MKNFPKKKYRNPIVVPAKSRTSGGPMPSKKHKRNKRKDFLLEDY